MLLPNERDLWRPQKADDMKNSQVAAMPTRRGAGAIPRLRSARWGTGAQSPSLKVSAGTGSCIADLGGGLFGRKRKADLLLMHGVVERLGGWALYFFGLPYGR